MHDKCRANKSWGIGTTVNKNRESISYGYPVTDDPNLFFPDYECCTPEEIKNHELALKGEKNE